MSAARHRMSTEPLALAGGDTVVPLLSGEWRRYVHLDYAASTPALVGVRDGVDEFLPWYSSVHRGSGFLSTIATAALEGAREAVGTFVGCRDGDVVIFVRNATDAVNLLSASRGQRTRVLSSPIEHHANMLPWRDHDVQLLPFPSYHPTSSSHVTAHSRAAGAIDLLAVTGASNVTGEVWPIGELARLAHHYGAEIFVDAAQLCPHRPLDIAVLDLDYVALSGHKLYAPYGAGALFGRPDRLRDGTPLLKGGGAIKLYEAGSPNVIGAVALGVACDLLKRADMDRLVRQESALADALRRGLGERQDVRILRLWPDNACDHVGVATFTLEGYQPGLVAAILSAGHGIGVRHGRFCAHPLLTRLLDIPDSEANAIRAASETGDHERVPSALRASIGVRSTGEDIDALLTALDQITQNGPRWRYRRSKELHAYAPDPEPRALPTLACRLRVA